MTFNDLKVRKDAPLNHDLKDEQRFVYWHGLFNCKVLKLKDANSVIKNMEEYDSGCLTLQDKKFILERSGKEVLCYLINANEANTDIFIYGDDNIAFTVDCFV